ncbi:uncharacterized protein BO87DRAFT_264472, partial [Aspergillus neoniger CBS 115656]
MQDCGSFLSLWGQMNVSTSRRNLAELYTSVAERIITDTWDLQSHPRHITRCVNVAAALFDNPLNVDSRDFRGQTCLGIAVLHNHPAMVLSLIARGANVNNRRRDGQTVWTQI